MMKDSVNHAAGKMARSIQWVLISSVRAIGSRDSRSMLFLTGVGLGGMKMANVIGRTPIKKAAVTKLPVYKIPVYKIPVYISGSVIPA